MKYYIFFFLLVTINGKADDSRFSWLPHLVSPTQAHEFFLGSESLDDSLKQHIKNLYQRDRQEFDLDANLEKLLTLYQTINKKGLQFEGVNDEWIEYQWIIVDYVYDFEQSYQRTQMKVLDSAPLRPILFQEDKGLSRVFSGYSVDAQRYPQMSCLEDKKFGICVYNYIYLTPDDVKLMLESIKSNPSEAHQQLKEIMVKATQQRKGVLFIGLS